MRLSLDCRLFILGVTQGRHRPSPVAVLGPISPASLSALEVPSAVIRFGPGRVRPGVSERRSGARARRSRARLIVMLMPRWRLIHGANNGTVFALRVSWVYDASCLDFSPHGNSRFHLNEHLLTTNELLRSHSSLNWGFSVCNTVSNLSAKLFQAANAKLQA